LQEAASRGIEIISEIEFGYRIKHPASKIIAVTGSNGKSTTVSLIHHLLLQAGMRSELGGNIGTAFTAHPIEAPGLDVIVLELSSFQLERVPSFRPDVALLLNISPDHLNRYPEFDAYAQTKFNIFAHQKSGDIAVINADDPVIQRFATSIPIATTPFSLESSAPCCYQDGAICCGGQVFDASRATIRGKHNHANIMAALLAVQPFGISQEILQRGLETFVPLPHRLEFVRTIDDVAFFNDSKATNTDSVKYALQAFNQPIRIILGGAGKGEDYRILNPLLKKYAKKIYLTGATATEMETAFRGIAEIALIPDFAECIQTAWREAAPGDKIVLSPACTSYDAFANFEERGNRFKEIVQALA
jgi:UDP-N-acetylmuramoylalanine--D-glutamate ligase